MAAPPGLAAGNGIPAAAEASIPASAPERAQAPERMRRHNAPLRGAGGMLRKGLRRRTPWAGAGKCIFVEQQKIPGGAAISVGGAGRRSSCLIAYITDRNIRRRLFAGKAGSRTRRWRYSAVLILFCG